MSIPMPITFLDVPELINELPQTNIKKDVYKKENRLELLSRQYKEANGNKDKRTVIDLSIKVIFERIISTISSIIEDLINLDNYNIRNVMKIFIEGDRMVYFGIFIVLVSILLFLIEMSS
jgi:hypothetical protein